MIRKTNTTRKTALQRRPVNPNLATPYNRMTVEQLEHEVEVFDNEFIASEARALTREEVEQDKAARRGRPQVGNGAQKIRISIERGLLERADATAKSMGTSRSRLIAIGLKLVVAPGKGGSGKSAKSTRKARNSIRNSSA